MQRPNDADADAADARTLLTDAVAIPRLRGTTRPVLATALATVAVVVVLVPLYLLTSLAACTTVEAFALSGSNPGATCLGAGRVPYTVPLRASAMSAAWSEAPVVVVGVQPSTDLTAPLDPDALVAEVLPSRADVATAVAKLDQLASTRFVEHWTSLTAAVWWPSIVTPYQVQVGKWFFTMVPSLSRYPRQDLRLTSNSENAYVIPHGNATLPGTIMVQSGAQETLGTPSRLPQPLNFSTHEGLSVGIKFSININVTLMTRLSGYAIPSGTMLNMSTYTLAGTSEQVTNALIKTLEDAVSYTASSITAAPPATLCRYDVCPSLSTTVGALLGYAEPLASVAAVLMALLWQARACVSPPGKRSNDDAIVVGDGQAQHQAQAQAQTNPVTLALIYPRLVRNARPLVGSAVATMLVVAALLLMWFFQLSQCPSITTFSAPGPGKSCAGVSPFSFGVDTDAFSLDVVAHASPNADVSKFALSMADLNFTTMVSPYEYGDASGPLPWKLLGFSWERVFSTPQDPTLKYQYGTMLTGKLVMTRSNMLVGDSGVVLERVQIVVPNITFMQNYSMQTGTYTLVPRDFPALLVEVHAALMRSFHANPPGAVCQSAACLDDVALAGAVLGYAETFFTAAAILVAVALVVVRDKRGHATAASTWDVLVHPKLRHVPRPRLASFVATSMLVLALGLIWRFSISASSSRRSWFRPPTSRASP